MAVAGIGSFHVHGGHDLEGFQIEDRLGGTLVVTRCVCGEVLDVADATFAPCPSCSGRLESCVRCGGTGFVVDHAALVWRLPEGEEH